MSEPVKKDEVEDVLTSIRRLVSAGASAPAVQSAITPATIGTDGKLILSQAQRVDGGVIGELDVVGVGRGMNGG